MKSTTALTRHSPHLISLGLILASLSGCGPSVRLPIPAMVSTADYVAVTSTPRAPPIEFIPPRPRKDAVWVDGSWDYGGNRFGWRWGTWAVVPEGLRRARWTVVRRRDDGQLFFAPASWKDPAGKTVDDAAWIHALGPDARARSRIGGPAEMDELPPRGERANAARDQERKPEDTTEPPQPRQEGAPGGTELR